MPVGTWGRPGRTSDAATGVFRLRPRSIPVSASTRFDGDVCLACDRIVGQPHLRAVDTSQVRLKSRSAGMIGASEKLQAGQQATAAGDRTGDVAGERVPLTRDDLIARLAQSLARACTSTSGHWRVRF
jgi:hypothetical protein